MNETSCSFLNAEQAAQFLGGLNARTVTKWADVLSPEKFQALIKELSVRDLAMVLLVGSTGFRRAELMALVWTDLNVQTMEVTITKTCVPIGSATRRRNAHAVPFHSIR